MQVVFQVIQRLLPHGSRAPAGAAKGQSGITVEPPGSADWRLPPVWPPDLFAVCATLLNLSGCYADASLTEECDARDYMRLGRIWRGPDVKSGKEQDAPGPVGERKQEAPGQMDVLAGALQRHWDRLLLSAAEPVSAHVERHEAETHWCGAALALLAIADEASRGMGYSARRLLAYRAMRWQWQAAACDGGDRGEEKRWRRAATLCDLVPPEVCCVQPKARTPQVGCSLRSLSNNLALLPPIGEVTTRYLVSPLAPPAPGKEEVEAFNLMLVPYPYRVGDSALRETRAHDEENWRSFRVSQDWLAPLGAQGAEPIAGFVEALVERAVADAKDPRFRVHGVVFPEAALEASLALKVGQMLAARGVDIDLLVAGAMESAAGPRPRNSVLSMLFSGGHGSGKREVLSAWKQSKHHRWKIDRRQQNSYGFAGKAPPRDGKMVLWEDIDVSNREVTFYQLPNSAVLATLICEDLARVDPVQPVVRAVGPNLVIGLLFDGPQLQGRWPGRACALLSDDPGSSVLTFTSAGPVARYRRYCQGARPGQEGPLAIALWNDDESKPQSISLEPGAQAVVLELELGSHAESTLDRRSDEGATMHVRLKRRPAPDGSPGEPRISQVRLARAEDWRILLEEPAVSPGEQPPPEPVCVSPEGTDCFAEAVSARLQDLTATFQRVDDHLGELAARLAEAQAPGR